MRTDNQRESGNVEDRRGMPRGAMVGGGLGALIIAILYGLLGGEPPQQGEPGAGAGDGASPAEQIPDTPEAREAKHFVSVVLADTEDVWRKILPEQSGGQYEDPVLVLFTGRVDSACGRASSASGPFYCPADSKLYLDFSFFDELRTRFRAPGDFAQAYVIAHEVGHHVQKLRGISDMVQKARARLNDHDYSQLSVRMELQADFYAGVWAHHAQQMRRILEEGDIDEALGAANAIGDDRLQKQSQGYVVPDSFTHGTSQQRVRWFKKGFQSGDLRQGDTFKVPYESL